MFSIYIENFERLLYKIHKCYLRYENKRDLGITSFEAMLNITATTNFIFRTKHAAKPISCR